jgi:hypothetical protein
MFSKTARLKAMEEILYHRNCCFSCPCKQQFDQNKHIAKKKGKEKVELDFISETDHILVNHVKSYK